MKKIRAKNATVRTTRADLLPLRAQALPKVHPELSAYFGYCLQRAALRLRTLMDVALEDFGVIAPQLGILRVLQAKPQTSQAELGEYMAIDKATIVKLIDGLESKGCVIRETSKSDRRVKFIRITREGVKFFHRAAQVRIKVEKEFFKSLNETEKNQLIKIIPKLLL